MPAPSKPSTPKRGTVLGPDWVFHNCSPEVAAAIMMEGMDAGSFADRPIDFGRKAWVAAPRSAVAPYSEHQYGEAIAIEPTYEVWKTDLTGKDRRTIPAGVFVRVNSRARVL